MCSRLLYRFACERLSVAVVLQKVRILCALNYKIESACLLALKVADLLTAERKFSREVSHRRLLRQAKYGF